MADNQIMRINVNEEKEIWNLQYKQAEHLIKSGAIPASFTRPEHALAVIQYGRELGYQPMTALQNINIIKGKTTMSANMMAARFKGAGNDFYIKSWNDTICELAFISKDSKREQVISYTIEDAKKAELLNKDNWKKNPKEMLYARCISKGVKIVDPTIMMGFYIPEELGAEIDEEGNVITQESKTELKQEEKPVEKSEPVEVEDAEVKEIEKPKNKKKKELDMDFFRPIEDEWKNVSTIEQGQALSEKYKEYDGIALYDDIKRAAKSRLAKTIKKTPEDPKEVDAK